MIRTASANTSPKLATVFGGSGFLGRHVVRALVEKGFRVRVACRRPDLAGHLQPLGGVGQIHCMQANLRHRWSVDRAVEGADVVINLVGVLAENSKQTFDAVQARGAGWVADAAANAGARVVHVSAIGADENSAAEYAQTKALGEKLVREATPDAIILRPSIIFGPEDDFFNRFASMATLAPALPLIGGGKTLLQPVYVGDVARAIALAAKGSIEKGTVWELGGPEVLSFKECLQRMMNIIDRPARFISLPFAIAKLMGSVAQYLPGSPITPDQVELLKTDNVVSQNAQQEGQTLQSMGITPTALSAVLPKYLVRFRKYGQFVANRGL